MAGVSRELRAERRRYWQGLVEQHSRSGLSVLEFCKERKVAATSFYQWRTKLQQGAEPYAAPLLPVKIVSVPRVAEPAEAVTRGCIQVFTPSGVSLTLSGASAEADLVKVLRAIDAHEASRSC